ncbi:hypothetical protein KC866_01505 [Patescibacteria group bacterium]|nr:hypothetical protein [Patescibacteria group bacterium]
MSFEKTGQSKALWQRMENYLTPDVQSACAQIYAKGKHLRALSFAMLMFFFFIIIIQSQYEIVPIITFIFIGLFCSCLCYVFVWILLS